MGHAQARVDLAQQLDARGPTDRIGDAGEASPPLPGFVMRTFSPQRFQPWPR